LILAIVLILAVLVIILHHDLILGKWLERGGRLVSRREVVLSASKRSSLRVGVDLSMTQVSPTLPVLDFSGFIRAQTPSIVMMVVNV
jgi:hypothetical protein